MHRIKTTPKKDRNLLRSSSFSDGRKINYILMSVSTLFSNGFYIWIQVFQYIRGGPYFLGEILTLPLHPLLKPRIYSQHGILRFRTNYKCTGEWNSDHEKVTMYEGHTFILWSKGRKVDKEVSVMGRVKFVYHSLHRVPREN